MNKDILDPSSEEIDLNNFLKLLLRRKLVVISITTLGLLFSYFYAKQKPPIYEGGFQIVLDSGSRGNNPIDNITSSPLLTGFSSSLTSINRRELQTEVSILKSSSVLKPVYEFVVKNKYNNDYSRTSYKSWVAGSLDIKLIRGTSVLDITYFDSEKALIKPVLNQISEVYQSYSGRERENGLNKSLKFAEEQLIKMKLKSEKSLSKYQEFALENSLGNRDGLTEIRPMAVELGNISNLESLAQLSTRQENSTTRFKETYKNLILLENQYLEKSTFLKPNSEYLTTLKAKINKIEESLSRPKEILLKHRELKRDSIRDEELLANLENQVVSLKLQIAKQNDPWELISDTTITNKPISPNVKQILLLGTIFSFVFSILIAFLTDRFKGLIYSKDYFEKTFSFPLLISLPSDFGEMSKDSLNFLPDFITSKKSINGLNIFTLGNKECKEERNFCKQLEDTFSDSEINITNQFSKIEGKYETIIICSYGNVSRKKLSFLNQQINLMTLKPLGWIYLDI